MEIKTSWLFTVPSGIVKFVSAVASFHLSRDKGVSCESSVNEKIVATLCWDVRSSRKVELRILDTERLNVISNKKIEYLFPEYLDGVRWLVTIEGRFDMVLNMKDMVDKVASAELIKRKIVPDSANAISLLYSKKTSDRPDLVTLRKQIEEKIEKMVKNFWWDIYQAYLQNEKGILHVLPLHEFNGGTRMKMIKPLKSGKKILVPKLDQLMKEYIAATDPVSGKDVSWKTAKSAYSSEIMFGEKSSKPHVCCSSSCTEVAAEIKGLLFHDVYLTMKKYIFLNENQNDNEFINTELQGFASESRFMYQKYCKKYPSMQHELFCYVQDLYEEVGVGEGKKLTIEKIEEIIAKMLGHPNTDTQLLVDNVNPIEFFNFVSSELYKTNYAFSHINFINLKVQCTYGFLIKLGGKLKNKWQDRYFILDRVLGLLVYYKKPPSRSFEAPAGMIHVTDLQDVERSEIAVSPKIFCLNLQPKDKMKKMYQIGTTSQAEIERWTKELKKTMKEWQDLEMTYADGQLLKSTFRLRHAMQYATVQQTLCAPEMIVKP